jgi:adenosylhomocysteine nucleosidase
MATPGAAAQPAAAPILVAFATREESRAFRSSVIQRSLDVDVRHIGGMGPTAAEHFIGAYFAKQRPRLVILAGFAGGLNPDFKPGQVLFTLLHAEAWEPALTKAGAVRAQFACTDRVLTTIEEKAACRAATDADAVEMESAPIQAACRERGIPFLMVRSISDAACEDLPVDFNRFANSEGRISMGKILAAMAARPRLLFELLAFKRRLAAPARSLANVLTAVLESSTGRP